VLLLGAESTENSFPSTVVSIRVYRPVAWQRVYIHKHIDIETTTTGTKVINIDNVTFHLLTERNQSHGRMGRASASNSRGPGFNPQP
jgi:hypothetical protein